MNVSYNWLSNYIKSSVSVDELSKILTSIGLEVGTVEKVQTIKGGLEGFVIAEVLTCGKHQNSDHLSVTTVSIGEGEPFQVVCGAPNVAAGQKVVLATVGTKIYNHDVEGDEHFVIKRSKIRGEESFGMLCAEDEMGLGKGHDGILVLPADAVVGTPAKEYFNVKDDYLIEVDITPNRIDAASHYGVARDLAAYFAANKMECTLTKPSVDDFKIDNTSLPISIEVKDNNAAPRYSGLTISGIEVKPSPEWLQDALRTIGLRPINNVVDATNFILHELGQPLHAFDYDMIKGGKVVVSQCEKGTKFVTLDEVERTLSGDDLMICNEEAPMCIAGVFGGLTSGVTEATTRIFIESAYFNPVSVRKTARRHGLNTDASFRYERGADPNITIYALKRVAMLIKEIAGGEISSEIIDIYPTKIENFVFDVKTAKINSLIGKEIPTDIVEAIFAALEIEVLEKTAEGYKLSVPPYRVDIQRDVDVIEEILRLYGYNNIDFSMSLKSSISYQSGVNRHKWQELLSEQLTSAGFNEILNNSLTKGGYYEGLTSYPAENSVKLLNPLSQDLNVMRQTLLFGGLESIVYNINRRNADLKFYEFGNCYKIVEDKATSEDLLAKYVESAHLGLWITGKKQESSWLRGDEKSTIFELKGYCQNILRRAGVSLDTLVVNSFSDELFAEGLLIATKSGKVLIQLGEVAKKVRKMFDIDQPVFYADINFDLLVKEIKKKTIKYKEISKFPEVKRDLALLIDKSVQFAELEKIAYQCEKKLLKSVQLFDVYEGKNLEEGKKSYAVSFVLQDSEKTLNDKQIDAIMTKIISAYTTQLNAKLR